MMSERAQRLRSRAGYSLIELLTAIAIFGVLAAAGLPHIDTRRQDIQSATKQIISDYRWARARAITGGVHFNVTWTATNVYQVQRLKLVGTTWTLDTVVKTVTMPSYIARYGYPNNLEFNTRGMMVSSATAVFDTVWDSQYSTYRTLAVWPSGQANAYN